jgi:hypothetical protein
MANAPRDENRVPALLGTLNTDGATIVPVLADATLHALTVSDGSTGSDNGPVNAPRDGNRIPALLATSSADGVTPVVVYADTNGALLIQST